MSIKPIDAQVMLHNTPDAAKIQSVQTNRDPNAQVQSALAMHKKIENDAEQVTGNTKVEDVKINKKPEKDKQQQQQKKKNKDENQTEGSNIDIRI